MRAVLARDQNLCLLLTSSLVLLPGSGSSLIIRGSAGSYRPRTLREKGGKKFFMVLVLAADGAAASGTRIVLFVLLVIAILLIVVGAIIAIVTMYFYWKARSNKAETASAFDLLSRGE